jgi:hypothetical protein
LRESWLLSPPGVPGDEDEAHGFLQALSDRCSTQDGS